VTVMTGRASPIDLNADVGESFGPWPMGQDEALIPLVTSVNIACGFHAGDPVVIERTIRLALASGAAIGAHPGYPDREGFGRRDLAMSTDELEASILYQVAALAGMVAAAGGTLRHVKAHGALYNRAVGDAAVAESIARAVRRISPDLVVVGPPASELLRAAAAAGLPVAGEGFADRAYEPDGTLRSRRLAGAVHTDPAVAAAQAVALANDGRYATLCVHGDTPNAPVIARAVRAALEAAGHRVAPA
jgi:5-oxoprolinase (ATP-hydrolysing) subunit A